MYESRVLTKQGMRLSPVCIIVQCGGRAALSQIILPKHGTNVEAIGVTIIITLTNINSLDIMVTFLNYTKD